MSLKEIYNQARADGKDEICRWMRDMRRVGLRMRYYEGRNFYKGPAVIVDDIQDCLSETKIKSQWDNMAFQFVVYPRCSL